MTARDDLHRKLDALAAEIGKARERLAQRESLREKHEPTGKALWERYKLLKAEVAEEIAEDEAQGEHVSEFERSVRAWVDEIDLET